LFGRKDFRFVAAEAPGEIEARDNEDRQHDGLPPSGNFHRTPASSITAVASSAAVSPGLHTETGRRLVSGSKARFACSTSSNGEPEFSNCIGSRLGIFGSMIEMPSGKAFVSDSEGLVIESACFSANATGSRLARW